MLHRDNSNRVSTLLAEFRWNVHSSLMRVSTLLEILGYDWKVWPQLFNGEIVSTFLEILARKRKAAIVVDVPDAFQPFLRF